jgi:hypothetical protein
MWLDVSPCAFGHYKTHYIAPLAKLSKKPERQKCAAPRSTMRLTEVQSRETLRVYGANVTEACDRCGAVLGPMRWTPDGSYLGSFACEYAGNGSVGEAEANLREAMQQLFVRRYKARFYKLEFGKTVIRTYTPAKSFGTILVGIGFASYLVPVLKPEVEVTPSHKDKSHVKYTTM